MATREYGAGLFPRELLKEAVPAGDIHTEEERRLLYVAMTRAQERLILTTIAGPAAEKDPSLFLAELQEGAGPELIVIDRLAAAGTAAARGVAATVDDAEPRTDRGPGLRCPRRASMPVPTARERRHALRSRATELLELLEGIDPADPEAVAGPGAAHGGVRGPGAGRAVETADEARAHGLDPLTLRVVALDSEAGANLLDGRPAAGAPSATRGRHLRALPAPVRVPQRLPHPSGRKAGALSFGSTAHRAFEPFTKERRERAARGEPPPTREDLERCSRRSGSRGVRGAGHGGALPPPHRPAPGRFWEGELSSVGRGVAGGGAVRAAHRGARRRAATFTGSIDRIDRLPTGGIEVIDYKTGRELARSTSRRASSCQHLRAGLPRCARPGHPGAGDALLHRGGHAHEHDAHRRAARCGTRCSWPHGSPASARATSRPRRAAAPAAGATTGPSARSACGEHGGVDGDGWSSCRPTAPCAMPMLAHLGTRTDAHAHLCTLTSVELPSCVDEGAETSGWCGPARSAW